MNQAAYTSLREAGMEEQQAVIIAEHTDMSAVMARFDQLDSKLDSKIDLLESKLTSELNRSIAQRVTYPLYLVLVAGIIVVGLAAFLP